MKTYRYPKNYFKLNGDQKLAMQMFAYGLDSGKNYFLTGDAGTGKSYLIDVWTDFCRLNHINLMKCAPTGVAATAIGGMTLHRLFKLPLTVLTDKLEGSQFANIYKKIVHADCLFIDEISMARVDIFDNVMSQVKYADGIRAKSGKPPIQVIICGDFGQLMPVVTEQDRNLYQQLTGRDIGNGCCYSSKYWDEMDFQPVMLTKPMRQADQEFCKALDNLKIGIKSDLDYLNRTSAQAPVKDGIWLCGYNRTADEKNVRGICQLPGDVMTNKARVTGKANIKQTNFAENLMYKNGARVVMVMRELKNPDSPYDNGTLGTITGSGRGWVKIRLDNGVTVTVSPVELPFYEYEVVGGSVEPREIGSVTQYPFKIGYAVTIHKAQGQTYDKMNLVPEIFMPGQLYVAMSRCKDLGQIYVQPDGFGRKLTPDKVMPNPETVKFLIKIDAEHATFRDWFRASLYQEVQPEPDQAAGGTTTDSAPAIDWGKINQWIQEKNDARGWSE